MSAHLQPRPQLWGMWGKSWGMVCGIKSLIHKGCGACGATHLTGACAGMRTHMRACVCRCVHVHAPHTPHAPHIKRDKDLQHMFAPLPAPHIPHNPFFKGNEMLEEEKRVIRCSPNNTAQMQRVVRNWPQLHSLVKGLQAQGLFPGLRSLQITLTGSPEFVGKGLGAIDSENASLGYHVTGGGQS